MRALVIGAVITVGAVGGVDVLGDLTQTRPDQSDRDGATQIDLAIDAKPGAGNLHFVADGLWGSCQGTVKRRLQADGWVETAPGRFRGTVYPALGEHARQRLTGCLEDATLDRVIADVVKMERVPVCASGTVEPTCAVVRPEGG
jgi:hypothetical protein